MTIFICTIPKLWIEDYTLTNPIFWTVFGAWFIGLVFGFIEGVFDDD
jgi:hypothetical protein